jgi:hypothetical protein
MLFARRRHAHFADTAFQVLMPRCHAMLMVIVVFITPAVSFPLFLHISAAISPSRYAYHYIAASRLSHAEAGQADLPYSSRAEMLSAMARHALKSYIDADARDMRACAKASAKIRDTYFISQFSLYLLQLTFLHA